VEASGFFSALAKYKKPQWKQAVFKRVSEIQETSVEASGFFSALAKYKKPQWKQAGFKRVRKIAKSVYWPRHVCLSARPSECHNLATTGRIFMEFDI
jgi:hypothetical protein